MNDKGLTIVELIISIVIISIIASFSVLGVARYLENARDDAFIEDTNRIMKVAKDTYMEGHSVWDDDMVTLKELVDEELIDFSLNDPYGGIYLPEQTIVVAIKENFASGNNRIPGFVLNNSVSMSSYDVVFYCKIVTTSATLGVEEDDGLTVYDESMINLVGKETIIERVTSLFDSNVTGSFDTSDSHDDLEIKGDIRKDTNVNTLGGDDNVTIKNDIENHSSLDTGDGDDTVDIGGHLKSHSTLDTGKGNDTVNVTKNVHTATLNTGEGNDVINITRTVNKGTIDSGTGDDDVNIDLYVYSSDIDTGDGNDELNIDKNVGKDTTVDTGNGDDSVTITQSFYDSTMNTGDGNDTLVFGKKVHANAEINTGNGSDSIEMDGLDKSTVTTGNGVDTFTVRYIKKEAHIDMGADNDELNITNAQTNFKGTVKMGSGDDTLSIDNKRFYSSFKGTFDGGSGNDTLVLPNISLDEWNKTVKNFFTGFETVILEDETLNL